MLKLHIVQAKHGDCLILEHGTSSAPQYILVDGGPDTVYEEYLRQELLDIHAAGKKLDLAILSHVDDDHVAGLLDLLADLKQQHDHGAAQTIVVDALWHNTFSQTLGPDVEHRFKAFMQPVGAPRGVTTRPTRAVRSIDQGDELTRLADDLEIPINPQFAARRLVCVDDAPKAIKLGDLSLRIVGPTNKNLENLRKKWLAWLKKQEKLGATRGPVRAAPAALKADESVPNLSSIMLLAGVRGKTILLTGDGRWSDLLLGLAQANLLGPDGTLHVTVLKLPHHGSQRNVSRKFFKIVTADKYVICANGRDDNPDFTTLRWLVETAREDGRTIELCVTNATDSTRQLVEKYAPDKYGYRITEMGPGKRTLTVEIAA